MSARDDDDSSASSYSSDELSDMLQDLDLDNNVLWESFRGSMMESGRMSSSGIGHEVSLSGELTEVAAKGGEVSSQTPSDNEKPKVKTEELKCSPPREDILERQDRIWSKRIKREEVYSHRYRATAEERDELEQLKKSIGVLRAHGNGFMDAITGKHQEDSSAQRALWDELVNAKGLQKQPQSILLKRGPCLWREESSSPHNEPEELSKEEAQSVNKEAEYEVILLTNGLILAKVVRSEKQQTISRLQFARTVMWPQVRYVQPYPSTDRPTDWQIILKDHRVWTFVCASAKQQEHWLRALEKVVIQHHMHSGRIPDLGWQYRYIHKPAFSMAVDPDRVDAVQPPPAALSKLDRYRGYAPLHYAVRCHNAVAVKCLLKIGADPNQPDQEDGRTPTDFAVEDETTPSVILERLKASGGKVREGFATGKGALFGQVAAVEEKRKKEKREVQQKKEAEAAQQQMNDNMRLLQQRGEQINEMGSKASDLNQGAQDFGALARKLKEKSKKQNSWMPF